MATELKLRRGTTSQHANFTGAEAEVTVDTDKNTVVVHDGSEAGGYPLSLQAATIEGRKQEIAQGFVQREGTRGDLDVNLAVAIELNLLGAPVAGGFYAGLIDTIAGTIIAADNYQTGQRYALIVGPKSIEAGPGKKWYTSRTGAAQGSDTRWDGLSATNATLALDDSGFEAHAHIADVRASDAPPATPGGSDWYMPAMDELELLYRNFKPNNADNFTSSQSGRTFPGGTETQGSNPSSDPEGLDYENSPRIPDVTYLEAFAPSGSEAMSQQRYWSATWAATGRAWLQIFTASGIEGFQSATNKDYTRLVRPVRRVVL